VTLLWTKNNRFPPVGNSRHQPRPPTNQSQASTLSTADPHHIQTLVPAPSNHDIHAFNLTILITQLNLLTTSQTFEENL